MVTKVVSIGETSVIRRYLLARPRSFDEDIKNLLGFCC
jgi:hypothetical protein